MNLALVRSLADTALENVERHRRRINALNVYPVPDGDTGTNLTLTMQGIVAALEASTATTAPELAADIQRAATMEAIARPGSRFWPRRSRCRLAFLRIPKTPSTSARRLNSRRHRRLP